MPSLLGFAQRLERDLNAVTACLAPPWNSRAVEGRPGALDVLLAPR
ncbi:hypothetical protein [Streptomyces niger]|nr:hypothetical protein [Streptomyces niger]